MNACPRCRSPVAPGAAFCSQCGASAPTPSQPFHGIVFVPGAVVELGWGRAVLGSAVGDGGMGTVYRGWLYYAPQGPRAGGRPHEVAVKVLHPALSGRAYVRRLFLGEAEALSALSHPNIVHYFGLAECAEQLAIVLEFVDGDPLDRVIQRHVARAHPGGLPALPFLRAWHYFQQLLGALAATHELGIVHRDVKPANVLIRHDGLAKLSDYGIARLPAEDPRGGGMQPGTGAYMSPEQVLGRPLDGRSDLYAAAIVLFELLTGGTPFEAPGRNELTTRAAQVDEPPPPLSQLVPGATPVLDRLMARALAKDPALRFQTAIEFGDAFRGALALPDTMGWQAQQAMARGAAAIVGPRAGKGATMPMAQVDADRIRHAIAGAYRG